MRLALVLDKEKMNHTVSSIKTLLRRADDLFSEQDEDKSVVQRGKLGPKTF
jgi:hypothetical protein